MKYLFICLFVCLSCSKEYKFQNNQAQIKIQIKNIAIADKEVRTNNSRILKKYRLRTFETVIDSLNEVESTSLEGVNLSNFKPISYQASKLSLNDKLAFQKEIKESNELWNKTDSINLIKITALIKKYGFPDFDKRKALKDSFNYALNTAITHTDYNKNSGKKLIKLIVKEYKKGRISEGSMRHILWDYNGRNGMIDTINLEKEFIRFK